MNKNSSFFKLAMFFCFVMIILLLSFIYVKFELKGSEGFADSDNQEKIYNPKAAYSLENSTISFANNIGGSLNETLLNVHKLGSVYYLLASSYSTDIDFEEETEGYKLFIASLNQAGTVTNLKVLSSEYVFIDSVIYNNFIVVAVKNNNTYSLIYINTQLNITKTLTLSSATTKLFTTNELLYVFFENEIYVYNTTGLQSTLPFVYDYIFLCHYYNNKLNIISLKENLISLNTLDNNVFQTQFTFEIEVLVDVINLQDSYILITKEQDDLVLTNFTTEQIIFTTLINTIHFESIVINKATTGLYVYISDNGNLYCNFLCFHGDIIVTTQINNLNNVIKTSDNNGRYFIYTLTLYNSINIIYQKDLYTTSTYAYIDSSIKPQNIFVIGLFVFVTSSENLYDYTYNNGLSDIFVFSLN